MQHFLERHSERIRHTACIPVKRTPAQLDLYPKVVNTYKQFNETLSHFHGSGKEPSIWSFDETNINLKATSAAHQKVIAAVGTKPILYLSDQDRYLMLGVFICKDGSTICPALLHPQGKRIPVANIAAWDDVVDTPGTLHIAAGRTAFMSPRIWASPPLCTAAAGSASAYYGFDKLKKAEICSDSGVKSDGGGE